MSIYGPFNIASPAEQRSQNIDEKMWERLEDLDRIKKRLTSHFKRERRGEVERRRL